MLKNKDERKTFEFDKVYPDTSSQKEVYTTTAAPIIESVLNGYNGTIIAYGSTGTGKTHTMFGTENTDGIIPQALEHIFTRIDADKVHKWEVSISYVQLYCEMIQDLLRPESSNLSIREDPRRGTFIDGCSSFICNSKEDCLRFLLSGDSNRNVACTEMNAQSSRSHACVMLNIEKRNKTINSKSQSEKSASFGKLFLVDLAGSERAGKSQVFGRHFSELKSINLSLSALGNCIAALADKCSHVPYRDSKLTRLLSDSLGGNSKTALVVTVGPSADDYFEINHSLTFGQVLYNMHIYNDIVMQDLKNACNLI